MVWEFILGIIVIGVLWLLYAQIVKPKKLLSFYKKQFGKFCKVYSYPFKPFGAQVFEAGKRSEKTQKDFFYYQKNVTCNFDVALSNFGDKILIELISPELARAFHEVDQQKTFEKWEFALSNLKRMVGDGITFSKGADWKHKRKVLTKMLNFSYIKSIVPKISALVLEKSAQLFQEKDVVQINIMELMEEITSSVVVELFFGGGKLHVSSMCIEGQKINIYMRKLMGLLYIQTIDPLAIIFGQKFVNLGLRKIDRDVIEMLRNFKKFTNDFVLKRLEEVKEKYEKTQRIKQLNEDEPVFVDFIEAFYLESSVEERKNKKFVDGLIDDFSTLYVAGTDSTSHTVSMAVYHCLKNERVLQKLKKQIKQNLTGVLEYQTINKISYLEAVLLENLRMYATANGIFPREALFDHQLTLKNGQKIQILKGTILTTQTIPIQYKEEIYKNPHEFRPENFLDSQNKISPPNPFCLMNFSAGVRSCIGKQLAMTEMKIILINLFQNYEIKISQDGNALVFGNFAYEFDKISYEIRKKK